MKSWPNNQAFTGKAKAPVEFGAKVVISVIEGYTLIEHISWDNFHEGNTFQASVEAYHTRFGCYPEAVIADQLYRTRENRRYCQARHWLRSLFVFFAIWFYLRLQEKNSLPRNLN
ncbi:hypothetical protein GCM10010965_28990 [Caldalkalibacillus thermarum]|nr:hypothetical protein GCM10010965_28990 [Caldalkalibacillus thermarum]